MKICHVCNAECEDNAELCPKCGAEFLGEEHSSEDLVEVILDKPTLVASVEDLVSAEIFRDILKDNDIPYTTDSNDGAAMKVMFGGGFVAEDIYVDESSYDKAKQLYEDFLKSEPSAEDAFVDEEEEN